MTGVCAVERVRIDKWLWAARFFKTRTLAADAVEAGRVAWNDARAKPAREVQAGDRLRIDNGSTVWVVEVLGVATQRGPASVAQTLYRETEESRARRAEAAARRKLFTEPTADLPGRPTKRDRRDLDRFRG